MNSKNARLVIANNLAAYRKLNHLSQFDLANISSISRSTICNIETKNFSVSLDVLSELCISLNIHPSFLFAKNKFEFVSFGKKFKNIVPINANVGDWGIFHWEEDGLDFYPLSNNDLKLFISLFNSIKNEKKIF